MSVPPYVYVSPFYSPHLVSGNIKSYFEAKPNMEHKLGLIGILGFNISLLDLSY